MLFGEEKTNLGRQKEFDVLKAFSIVFMIIIHVYEELSVADSEVLCTAPFDVILQFLGGVFAAPVFMFAMGLGLSYSAHRTPQDFFKRGRYLLIFSYCFNIVRFTIPRFIQMQYTGFVLDDIVYETFHVDILTFAGLAFLLIGLLKKIKMPVWGVVLLAVAMQTVGFTLAQNIQIEGHWLYLVAPFFHCAEPSYFSLLQWFIYPALGLLFAKYLRHVKNTDVFYRNLLCLCAVLLTAFSVTCAYIHIDLRQFFTLTDGIFYNQSPFHTFFSLCCILIALSIVHFACKLIRIPLLENAVAFLSNNLNRIYITQWMIIGWLCYLIFDGDRALSLPLIIPVALIVLILSCLIVTFCNKKKREA